MCAVYEWLLSSLMNLLLLMYWDMGVLIQPGSKQDYDTNLIGIMQQGFISQFLCSEEPLRLSGINGKNSKTQEKGGRQKLQ